MQHRMKAGLLAVSRFTLCGESQKKGKKWKNYQRHLLACNSLQWNGDGVCRNELERREIEWRWEGREVEPNIKQFITLPVTTCLALASPYNKCCWPTSNNLTLKLTVFVFCKAPYLVVSVAKPAMLHLPKPSRQVWMLEMYFFLLWNIIFFSECIQKWSQGYKNPALRLEHSSWNSYKATERLHKVSEHESNTEEVRSMWL